MTHIRFFCIKIAFCLGLFLICLPFSSGQDVSESVQTEPLVIKLSVDEVRLDVVVLDKKSRNPIIDLTAADFEVLQDDRRQEILATAYIDTQPDAAARSIATRKDVPNLPPLPTAALKEEDVRRTILFVVDDYGMTFENGNYAKMALRNFVEKQMQTGDMVAVLRTDYGNRTLNMFQSDKREVLARINAMPTTMAPRPNDGNGFGVGPGMYNHFLIRLHENQISTLSYSLSVMKNMPGRKILFMVTPLTVHADPTALYYFYNSYVRLADEALRAGVVVNLLDIDGLYNLKTNYADASVSPTELGRMLIGQQDVQQKFKEALVSPIPEPNPMPKQTGGITIRNSNFFLNGIDKEVESLMKGYYLISYAPPPDTFDTRGRKYDDFHSLKVSVKRKGAVVHTRSGFFGTLESEIDAAAPKQHPLIEAVYSPFQSTDLTVNMSAGYVRDAKAGYLVRSWIHLDPKEINIIEAEDGGARIDLETLCVTSDINGTIQDSKRAEFSLSNIKSAEDIAWIRQHGIRFALLLPVKKPGPYYIRVSVQDKESGKVGSAYQFLEIPDVGKKGLTLSNIFMITSGDDLNWMRSDVTKEIAEGVFFPMFQGEEVRSPALRTYMSGDNLQTVTMLYNAETDAIARSEIETQTILYKDGKEFLRGAPTPITSDKVDNSGSIPLLNRITVGSNMPPGDYVLQILASDKKNGKKKEEGVYQTLSFTVSEK